MTDQEIGRIYERLLAINFEISPQAIPDPGYISQKISECHLLFNEVESYFIRTGRELSMAQRALNNALAKYESDKEKLLTTDETIRSLPNIKDREAHANTHLKDDLKDIKEYRNSVSDLNYLLKAVNRKLISLTRANSDIKTKGRMIETQIKLGTPAVTDNVVQSFLEEMNKGIANEDSFKGSSTAAEIEVTVDPTEPLDVDALLSGEPSGDNLSNDGKTETESKPLSPDVTNVDNLSNDQDDIVTEPKIEYEPEWEGNTVPEDVLKEVEASSAPKPVVDLDAVLSEITPPPRDIIQEPQAKGGEKEPEEWLKILQSVNIPDTPKSKEPEKVLMPTKNPDSGLDLDALLQQFK